MPTPDEIYQGLKEAISANDLDKIKSLLNEARNDEVNLNLLHKEISFFESYNPIFYLACESNKTEVIKTFLEYGLNPNVSDALGKTPLMMAAYNGNYDVVKELIESKAILDTKNHLGNTALDVANNFGRKEIKELLIEKGASIDPSKPLINKITKEKLNELIDNQNGPTLNLAQLLKEQGYSTNLDYYPINIKEGKFSSVNLSGLSFKKCRIKVDAPYIDFSNCNLNEAYINGKNYVITEDRYNFSNALLDNAYCMVDKEWLLKHDEDRLSKANILVIDKNKAFKQNKLITTYKGELNEEGVCNGLSIEYARHIISNQNKDKEDNFIAKISSKTNVRSQNFINRVQHFQMNLQSHERIKITSKDLSEKGFIASLNPEHLKSNVLGISLHGNPTGHATAIHIVRDKEQNIVGYKFFDPNFGESPLLSAKEIDRQILKLYNIYSKLVLDNPEEYVSVRDLEAMVKELGVVKEEHNKHYNKDSKNVFKLMNAIANNDLAEIALYAQSIKVTHKSFSKDDIITQVLNNASAGVVKILISHNPYLDFKSQSQKTCKLLDARLDLITPDLIKIMIDKGLNIDQPYYGTNLLNRCILENKLEQANTLIKVGASIRDEHGNISTPVLKKIFELRNIEIDIKERNSVSGQTLLHQAFAAGAFETAKQLIEKGLNPLEKDNEGITALNYMLKHADSHYLGEEDRMIFNNMIDQYKRHFSVEEKATIFKNFMKNDNEKIFELLKTDFKDLSDSDKKSIFKESCRIDNRKLIKSILLNTEEHLRYDLCKEAYQAGYNVAIPGLISVALNGSYEKLKVSYKYDWASGEFTINTGKRKGGVVLEFLNNAIESAGVTTKTFENHDKTSSLSFDTKSINNESLKVLIEKIESLPALVSNLQKGINQPDKVKNGNSVPEPKNRTR